MLPIECDCAAYHLQKVMESTTNRVILRSLEYGISALKKQIPQKPITYKDTNRADCPICGATVRGIKEPFGDWCSKCGQAIDWSG